MVRKIILIWIVLFANSYAALQYLVRSTPAATALDTHTGAATTWNAGDDDWTEANIGFSFPFNGSTYTTVRINSNGMLYFGSSSGYNTGSNVNLPNSASAAAHSIYPYWDDLKRSVLLGPDGTIKYETLGSGDSQRFVVTWSNMPICLVYLLGACISLSPYKYSFQVVLYKNGDIRFRYPLSGGYNAADGSGATIGAQESYSPSYYDRYSYNSSSINFTFDILYSYQPSISVSKTSCVIYDPVNSTTNPKRIPGSTIRYAIQVSNSTYGTASNVFATDTVDSSAFDTSTIRYLQIQSGACNCTGVSSASNNGSSGSGDGVNPVILDYGSLTGVVGGIPVYKCGYFEVNVK